MGRRGRKRCRECYRALPYSMYGNTLLYRNVNLYFDKYGANITDSCMLLERKKQEYDALHVSCGGGFTLIRATATKPSKPDGDDEPPSHEDTDPNTR